MKLKIEDLKVMSSIVEDIEDINEKQAEKINGGIGGGDSSWPRRPPYYLNLQKSHFSST